MLSSRPRRVVALACLAVSLAAAVPARDVPALLDVIVVDDEGLRRPGMHVRVQPADEGASTAASITSDTDRYGRARFPSLLLRRPLVTVSDDAGSVLAWTVELTPGMWARVVLPVARPAREGRARVVASVRPPSTRPPAPPPTSGPLATVNVTVLDVAGGTKAFVDARLHARGSYPAVFEDITGDDGELVFRGVPAGTYTASAYTEGKASDEVAVHVAPGGAHDLVLTLRPKPSFGVGADPGGIACSVDPVEVATLPERGAPSAAATALPPAGMAAEPFERLWADSLSSRLAARVGTASYVAACGAILAGRLPAPESVRAEEFVNAFDDGEPARGEHGGLTTLAEVSDCPWAADRRLVRVEVRAAEVGRRVGVPANLILLVDASASMEESGGLALAQGALRRLASRLRADDSLGIVTYGGASGLVFEPVRASQQAAILRAIDRLGAGSSPAGDSGIETAYALVARRLRGRATHVVLVTDGDTNLGVATRGELLELAAAERAKGVMLTVVGLGAGRGQEVRLRELAAAGGGTFTAVTHAGEVVMAVLSDLARRPAAIARDVEIDVTMNPLLVARHRLVGAEAGAGASTGADLGAGKAVVALYEVVPTSAGESSWRSTAAQRWEEGPDGHATSRGARLMTVRLRWTAADDGGTRTIETPVIDAGGSFREASESFRWTTAAAGFASLLQAGEGRSGMTWDQLDAMAAGALGPDEDDARAVMLTMLRRAAQLSPSR